MSTTILAGLFIIAVILGWSPPALITLGACAILALTLDTRAHFKEA